MACGALVLVSDSGAPKELVADPLLIFQEGNAESLVSLLRRLANNPEACLRYRRSGMRRVQRYLSTEVEAKLLSKVLADVAKD